MDEAAERLGGGFETRGPAEARLVETACADDCSGTGDDGGGRIERGATVFRGTSDDERGWRTGIADDAEPRTRLCDGECPLDELAVLRFEPLPRKLSGTEFGGIRDENKTGDERDGSESLIPRPDSVDPWSGDTLPPECGGGGERRTRRLAETRPNVMVFVIGSKKRRKEKENACNLAPKDTNCRVLRRILVEFWYFA